MTERTEEDASQPSVTPKHQCPTLAVLFDDGLVSGFVYSPSKQP